MKTTLKKNQKTGLKSQSVQSDTVQKSEQRPEIDFARRWANRSLDTEKLLALLRSEAPRFFELAEVVGNWVWIQFQEKQPSAVTRVLAELGFHWNNARQTWQHPCGTIAQEKAVYDSRKKYRSYFVADTKAA